jgi:hypothetical protein
MIVDAREPPGHPLGGSHLQPATALRGRGRVPSRPHLIYRVRNNEGHSKDYDFSRSSMQEHWRAGYHDAVRTLRHPEALERPTNNEGVFTFDLAADGRE